MMPKTQCGRVLGMQTGNIVSTLAFKMGNSVRLTYEALAAVDYDCACPIICFKITINSSSLFIHLLTSPALLLSMISPRCPRPCGCMALNPQACTAAHLHSQDRKQMKQPASIPLVEQSKVMQNTKALRKAAQQKRTAVHLNYLQHPVLFFHLEVSWQGH